VDEQQIYSQADVPWDIVFEKWDIHFLVQQIAENVFRNLLSSSSSISILDFFLRFVPSRACTST
jgi:hypothetical protein